MAEYTFVQFQEEYPTDGHCLAKLMEINYGGTEITCPTCGVDRAKFHPMTKRRAYACQECGHHVYPAAGTIFHKSRTKLTVWFFAMYLMTSTRHGVAAKEIERQTGVTYKCAWRICHELRKLMATADYKGPLGGEGRHVEIDETLMGGEAHGKGKGYQGNKTIVFGMVERDGKITTMPVADRSNETLTKIIGDTVEVGTTITTDEHASYQHLGHYYQHVAITHTAREYVRGKHHTNTIEGHLSLFKRAVRGTHDHIS